MTLAIDPLRNLHAGHDIYVVAAGASAQFIDPQFFDNKYVIGVNNVWLRFACDYYVRKDGQNAQGAYRAAHAQGAKTIASKHLAGSHKNGRYPVESADYIFGHPDNRLTTIDLSVVGTDKIVVSYSTITSAIHIAAFMGAANIILLGHDCGTLDGQANMAGYPVSPYGAGFYRDFITQIEPQTAALRARLHEVYGCHIYSLNPFLNFGLEGHRYER